MRETAGALAAALGAWGAFDGFAYHGFRWLAAEVEDTAP
jgi:hypothetical protein